MAKENLDVKIQEKLASLPRGFTLDGLAQAMKDQQGTPLIERSADDFLKIIKDEIVRDKMIVINDTFLEDFYDAGVFNQMFFQAFCSDEKLMDKYTKFINQIKDMTVSIDGRGLSIYENICAGRQAGDMGLFRGIWNSLLNRVLNQKEDKKL